MPEGVSLCRRLENVVEAAGPGAAPVVPPAAKPSLSILWRCRSDTDLVQYGVAQGLPCALSAEKIQLFADGVLPGAAPGCVDCSPAGVSARREVVSSF